MQWPNDGDGARWLPAQRRGYLHGVGQVNVHRHRQLVGRVKTIQITRDGRRWMLVLSCEDVPTHRLPATGRQAGIDVGIVCYATLSDGTGVDNPRWGRAAAERLVAAQQRVQRAKRGSRSGERRRETVAARYRKLLTSVRTFTTGRPGCWSRGMTFWWGRIYRSPTWFGGQSLSPIPRSRGSFCPPVPGRNPG